MWVGHGGTVYETLKVKRSHDAVQWMLHGHRGTGWPRKRDLEKEMCVCVCSIMQLEA